MVAGSRASQFLRSRDQSLRKFASSVIAQRKKMTLHVVAADSHSQRRSREGCRFSKTQNSEDLEIFGADSKGNRSLTFRE